MSLFLFYREEEFFHQRRVIVILFSKHFAVVENDSRGCEPMAHEKILVIEDEEEIRELVGL